MATKSAPSLLPHLSEDTGKKRIYLGIGYLVAAWLSVAALLYTLGDPQGPKGLGFNDTSFLAVILVTGLYGIGLLVRPAKVSKSRNGMDALAGISLLAFLFSYFFALTANLDYVQRLALGSQAINLSIDSSVEQGITILRFFPLLLAYLWSLVWYRPKNWWVFPALMVTPFLHALAFPTQIAMNGLSFLILFILVPLFLALDKAPTFGSWWVRGFFWGLITTMVRNYWLGTYSLVTLQGVALVFTYRYGLFFLLGWPIFRFLKGLPGGWTHLRWLLLVAGFTVFEYWAGHSWVGYPWTLAGQALYQWTPFIQSAALGGVWMVSFVVYSLNGALAWSVERRSWIPGLVGLGAFGLIGLIGWVAMPEPHPGEGMVATYSELGEGSRIVPQISQTGRPLDPEAVRISLVQQNVDPRKADYDEALDSLIRLTELSTRFNPEFAVWSETAFPPNIRHWSQTEPKSGWERTLVRQVGRFNAFARNLGIPLMTGNDDYEEILDPSGKLLERTSYNAAILFDNQGHRVDTYHKMVLVPLTETFPYEDFFPGWFYRIFPGLENFFAGLLDVLEQLDVNLWGEGDRYVVFRVDGMEFSVPICFEDAFPYHVRDFVREGARVIVNISNDYWALDEVQAEQHYAAGLFRAVENRVPMVRSTASGVTGHIDAYGRLLARIPAYKAGFVVSDVVPAPQDMNPTLYTRWGDWFPRLLLILLIAGGTGTIVARIGDRRQSRKN
ncbi:MAG: apolipoprotein N-acyltransferase [Spirochaetales bacterium]|nr:apolipoprotein N-acyltransferase [Spirochaetales bacterium]